jgi:hypothetical protein
VKDDGPDRDQFAKRDQCNDARKGVGPRVYSTLMRHPSYVVASVALLAALGAGGGCSDGHAGQVRGRDGHSVNGPAPATDFLIAAGDSTFWVTTGRDGVHVRGAPLTLAKFDGRYYEVYVADDDRSFYDAVFVGQRIFRRDLLSGDSISVLDDSVVARAATGYAMHHPDEHPLESDEDAADDPASTVTGEVDILDIHGPFVSYEYRGSSAGIAGGGATVRHGVIDMRAHSAGLAGASLAAVLGATDAARVVAQGRQSFGGIRDSVIAADVATDSGDRGPAEEAVHHAARALAGGVFEFEATSFTLVDSNRTLGVAFTVPGRGARGAGKSLPLPTILINGQLPPWWAEVRPTLPELAAGVKAEDHWLHGRTEIIARYDSVDDDVRIVVRDSARREWSIARLPAPTHRVFWMDMPPADSVVRRALLRAFDESALYADDARGVRWRRPKAGRPPVRLAVERRAAVPPPSTHHHVRTRR